MEKSERWESLLVEIYKNEATVTIERELEPKGVAVTIGKNGNFLKIVIPAIEGELLSKNATDNCFDMIITMIEERLGE